MIFGRVIAEREYRVGRQRLLLQVGTPHPASWRSDFYCAFRLVGQSGTKVRRVFGLDAIQALMLAFDIIKVTLEATSPKIRWAGNERPGDVGIYKRVTSGLGMDFDRSVERLVDMAMLARGRKLERLAKKDPR